MCYVGCYMTCYIAVWKINVIHTIIVWMCYITCSSYIWFKSGAFPPPQMHLRADLQQIESLFIPHQAGQAPTIYGRQIVQHSRCGSIICEWHDHNPEPSLAKWFSQRQLAYPAFEDRPRFARIRFRLWTGTKSSWSVWCPISSGICLQWLCTGGNG